MPTDWIDPIVASARKLADTGRLTTDFATGWNTLEDNILALNRASQIDLFYYASGLTRPADVPAALILLSMIPDEIVDAAEA